MDAFHAEGQGRWRSVLASHAIIDLGEPAVEPLVALLKDGRESARLIAASAVGAMQDARAGQVYAAAFEGSWPPKRLLEDAACPLTAFVERARALSDRLCFVGDGALRHKDWLLENLGASARVAPPHALYVRAAAVAALAALRPDEAGDYQTLIPYYLRLPQAERERAEREARHA
jgi:tRNA threonylcarbamoyladenosine biosynthesis protein TsaB